MTSASRPLTILILLIVYMAFSSVSAINAQESSNDLVIDRRQNKKWINDFRSMSIRERSEALKQRLLADTAVYFVSTANPHGPDPKKDGYKEKTNCRPLYIFSGGDGEPVHLNNNPRPGAVKRLTEYLDPEHIGEIEVLTGIKVAAIHASRASCGLIFIKIKSPETLGQIRTLL